MFEGRTHQVEDHIVCIHEPHIRPIVRGKARAKTEFGSKIHLSMVDGYSFLDAISRDAFNEGSHLSEYVENYRERSGFYLAKVLADKLYCTRQNRKWLKGKGIKLAALAVGRKAFLFAGSHKAAEMTAAMYSFMASCKKNGINEFEWLRDVFERIQSHKQKDLYQLLPNNWQEFRPKPEQ